MSATIQVPESLLHEVLQLRQCERRIANWKLENDEREDAIQRAEEIEQQVQQLLDVQK